MKHCSYIFNNKISSYWLILIFVIIASCSEDDSYDEQTFLDSKNRIEYLNANSKLLTHISYNLDNTVLCFESDTIVLDAINLENIEEDNVNWKATLFFHDNTSLIVGMLGDTLSLNENVTLNPSGVCPLSAQLIFSTPTKGKIKFSVIGKTQNSQKVEGFFDTWDTSHDISILGLYPDYKNQVEITLLDKENNERARTSVFIDIPPLAENLQIPSVELISSVPEKMEKGLTLISSPGPSSMEASIPFMIDNDGEVRWVLDMKEHPVLTNLSYGNGIEPLKNGNLYFADKSTSSVYEIDMFGNIVSSWPIPSPYLFHHNIQVKENGNFLVNVTKEGSLNLDGKLTDKDYLIEIAKDGGEILTVWDLKISLDENRMLLATGKSKGAGINWAHVNAVIASEEDNTIIVSSRYQGLIKLSYDNKVKWILAPHKAWGKNQRQENLSDFLLQPLDASGNTIDDEQVLLGDINHADFEWAWRQHSPLIMPNGNIALFDNGSLRNFTGEQVYSRAVEYQIDEENMTIQQIWQYGKERGAETYSKIVSDVDFLPESNNILFCPGNGLQNSNGTGGRIIEVDYKTREVVFEIAISANSNYAFHRAERMPMYLNFD